MIRVRRMFKKWLGRVSLSLTGQILALVCLSAGIAHAYVINTVNGNRLDWASKTNPNPMGEDYLVNENCTSSDGEPAAVQQAARTWSRAGAKFTFSYGGTTTAVAGSYDGINCISWSSSYFPPESATLAETIYWYNPDTGDILECDCVFNDNKNWSTAVATPYDRFDIESVMLHEFGHYLSLWHSDPPAVMQPTLSNGTQRRTLTSDDKAGIIAMYGRLATGRNAPCFFLLLP